METRNKRSNRYKTALIASVIVFCLSIVVTLTSLLSIYGLVGSADKAEADSKLNRTSTIVKINNGIMIISLISLMASGILLARDSKDK